jgi:signal transduction histidine kinase
MDDKALRDHAHQMLMAFAADLDHPQSDLERADKSKGMGQRDKQDTAAETHAEARLLSGYTVVQLVSEYRALRSSVLSLWSKQERGDQDAAMVDMTRFNEAVDQAVAESVARYEHLVKQSQNMFLAILGHDLRNPLATVVIGASFIMQAKAIPPQYTLAATRMFNSAKRMSNLVTDLIDFTRTHLGPGIPIHAKQNELVACCRQVVEELRTFHPERRFELDAPARLEAWSDAGRVAQMLSNLIGNAIQHGSAETPIEVGLSGSTDEVLITVHNQGPLIPADQLSTIFDPLVRLGSCADDDAAGRGSLGIGLYIAREISHAHGGQINVSSDAGHGTTFTVSLPRLAES